MKKKHKSVWLLTIASGLGVAPGCSDGGVTDQDGPDVALDGGIVVRPPDAGRLDASVPGIDAGLVVAPPDAGTGDGGRR